MMTRRDGGRRRSVSILPLQQLLQTQHHHHREYCRVYYINPTVLPSLHKPWYNSVVPLRSSLTLILLLQAFYNFLKLICYPRQRNSAKMSLFGSDLSSRKDHLLLQLYSSYFMIHTHIFLSCNVLIRGS